MAYWRCNRGVHRNSRRNHTSGRDDSHPRPAEHLLVGAQVRVGEPPVNANARALTTKSKASNVKITWIVNRAAFHAARFIDSALLSPLVLLMFVVSVERLRTSGRLVGARIAAPQDHEHDKHEEEHCRQVEAEHEERPVDQHRDDDHYCSTETASSFTKTRAHKMFFVTISVVWIQPDSRRNVHCNCPPKMLTARKGPFTVPLNPQQSKRPLILAELNRGAARRP